MSKASKLTSFLLVTLTIVLSGLQYKIMSPRLYTVLAMTVAIGSEAIYNGEPASFFNWE